MRQATTVIGHRYYAAALRQWPVWAGAVVLAAETLPAVGVWGAVGVTVVLAGAAGAAAASSRGRRVCDVLLIFAAISIFGWVSSLLMGVPPVERWMHTVALPVAFLTVNATKLSSVAVLAVIARGRGWDRDSLLLRVGDPYARAGIAGLRWTVLGPVVIVVVGVAFLTAVPPHAWSRAIDVVAWLPVMLLGAVINAVCEEILYRHAVIATGRAVIGVVPAIVMSCALFGFAHISGNPGGPTGVLYTAAYGAVCAAAMLQARGMCWNIPIHIGGDLAIVATLTLTQLAR